MASQNSESVRRMVRQTDQTRNVAGETLTVLDTQSEQLKRMHGEIDKVEENLNFADRTIRGMESVWGSFRNYVSKGTAAVKGRPQSAASAAEGSRLDRAAQGRPIASRDAPAGAAAGGEGRSQKPIREYSEDWQGKLQKMEDNQDDDLDDLSKMVGQLKDMGRDMGHTLNAQTTSIDRLADRSDAVDSRLAKSNLRIKRML